MADLLLFGQRIKQLRQELGLSQRDFAEKIGVTASALSAYEKGLKNPSVNVAVNTALAFDVSLDWLCGLMPDGKGNRKYCEVRKTLEYLMAFVDVGLLKLQIHTDGNSEWVTDATLSEPISNLLLLHNQLEHLLAKNNIANDSYEAIHATILSNCTDDALKALSTLDHLDDK